MDPHHVFLTLAAALPMLVLGESAVMKLIARETPEWFRGQFAGSWLGRFPAGPQWWLLTVIELGAALLLGLGLVLGESLPGGSPYWIEWGLLASALSFVMITFGLRVAADFAGAANGYFYAAMTLVLYALVAAQ